jgi:hypothetical protein
MLTAVFTKHNGAWKITSLQVTNVDPDAQAHNPVQNQAGR